MVDVDVLPSARIVPEVVESLKETVEQEMITQDRRGNGCHKA